MAFVYTNFQKWSQGNATGSVNNQWAYYTSDAIATVVTNGYFNSVNGIEAGVTANEVIRVNDLIWVVASDYQGYVLVSDTSPTIVSAQFQITVGAGAVGTSNLADDAVTTAKIDDEAVTSVKIAPNTIASTDIATDVIQYVNVPVTAAQVNGAYATPFVLIAAGGANTLIRIHDVTIELDYGSAQFAGGGAMALQYDNTANGAGVLASAALAAATLNGFTADSVVGLAGAAAAGTAAATVNKGIYLSNLTGAFTTGTGSVLNFHISYSIVTTAL